MLGSVSSIKPWLNYLRRERTTSLMDRYRLPRKAKRRRDSINPLSEARLPVKQVSLTPKSKDVLARLLAEDSSANINNLLSCGAINIQDLVRLLNGGGLKRV